MNNGRLLYKGIQAFKTGQMDKAQRLMEEVLADDESNETAWLGLSSVMEDIDQKRICLENVLFINPENEVAQERLGLLPQRKAEADFWLWRLARRPSSPKVACPNQIQPLPAAQNSSVEKGSVPNKQTPGQASRIVFLLAGFISLLLLTAILVAVI